MGNLSEIYKKMVDCSDEALAEAYNDVRNDKSDTDWVLCGYTDDGKSLEIRGSGSGGLDEMKEHFVEDQCMYGYLRVTSGDEESVRQKFVLVSWCGPNVKALKKARMSVHKASFKQVFREYSVEIHYTDLDDIDYDELRSRVVKSGGSYFFYSYCLCLSSLLLKKSLISFTHTGANYSGAN